MPELIVFTVQNGGEIPPQRLKEIFWPFATDAEDGHVKGRGLGLYIVKCFVEAHSGAIDITSSGREGTRTTVTLPRTAVL